jgi:hypothetical protein
LKPGPAPTGRPGRPVAGTGPGWRKNKKSHDSIDLATRLTRQNPVATRCLFFFFFTKTTLFWFFLKIEIDLADLVTRSKLGTRALDRANYQPGLKTIIIPFSNSIFSMILYQSPPILTLSYIHSWLMYVSVNFITFYN